jgi:hypothetical protein
MVYEAKCPLASILESIRESTVSNRSSHLSSVLEDAEVPVMGDHLADHRAEGTDPWVEALFVHSDEAVEVIHDQSVEGCALRAAR